MSESGFVLGDYDLWKCTEPAPERPDPEGPHDQCDRVIAERDARIRELEAELAAIRVSVTVVQDTANAAPAPFEGDDLPW